MGEEPLSAAVAAPFGFLERMKDEQDTRPLRIHPSSFDFSP